MTAAVLWQSVGDIARGLLLFFKLVFTVGGCLFILGLASLALAAAREHLARRRDVRTVKARGRALAKFHAGTIDREYRALCARDGER